MLSIDDKVTAVIVNYNAGAFLTACLRSVLPQVSNVVVVDNASSDTSVADCKQLFANLANLKFILSESNKGFSSACNIGLDEASTPYVLFLNPDCCLDEGAVDVLLGELRADLKTGMVGGLLLNPDGSEQAGGRRLIPTPWRSLVRVLGLKHLSNVVADFDLHKQPLPTQPVEVEAISGACMLVRQEAIDDVGDWDEQYFLHCEDLDWCMRFREKGWKIIFAPKARITHALGVSSQSRPIFVEWHKHKGMARFYNKFFKQKYAYPVMLLMMLGIGCRFLLLAAYLTGRRITFAIRKAMS
ncbi:MAG: glycosyltransferase family 2 protein [Methylophilaceae bacterium]